MLEKLLELMQLYRDAVSDLALHFFEKMKIMVVKDIEREDIEFICKVPDLFYFESILYNYRLQYYDLQFLIYCPVLYKRYNK